MNWVNLVRAIRRSQSNLPSYMNDPNVQLWQQEKGFGVVEFMLCNLVYQQFLIIYKGIFGSDNLFFISWGTLFFLLLFKKTQYFGHFVILAVYRVNQTIENILRKIFFLLYLDTKKQVFYCLVSRYTRKKVFLWKRFFRNRFPPETNEA